MTTIAWDGKTLATDSGCFNGETRMPGQVRKLDRINDQWIAVSGDWQDGVAFLEWMKRRGDRPFDFHAGVYQDAPPDVTGREVYLVEAFGSPTKPELQDSFCGLVWDGRRLQRYENKLVPWELPGPYYAAGSGRDFALAAMAAGCDARKAVEIACQFDPYSMLPVQASGAD